MADILIVDDDANLGMALEMSLRQAGHLCRLADNAAAGWDQIAQRQPDLALLDVQLPDSTGIELLSRIQDRKLAFPVIIMTAFGTVTTAVSAMKQGAADFIEKPLSVKDMCRLVMRLLKSRELACRIDARPTPQAADDSPGDVVTASPGMKQVVALADRIAALPTRSGIGLTTTLILGETGTGKERVARYIHARSGTGEAPFVHVNCTAIPETLFEMEHFGHERGVFTDAKTSKQGLLEAAHGGTLFLDEIGDMPQHMQGKLLVAIETGRFRRVGATSEQTVDARIIAATNCELEARASTGHFRPDLYHRLKMFQLRIPPLRERPEDIVALTERFLAHFSGQLGRVVPTLSPEAWTALRRHRWPGNVRELAHTLLQALVVGDEAVLTPARLELESVPTGVDAVQPGEAIELDFSGGAVCLAHVEKRLLQAALAHAGGNITEAAKLVGMPRGTFRYRLEKLGLA